MKHIVWAVVALLALAQPMKAQDYQPSRENLENRRQFAKDRFGIFLHWGIYSLYAQGEWYLQDANLDRNEYAKAANAFYPHNFNAEEWIKTFKEAGARYVTFTTRHHDGFSMWATQQSDYNIMHTPYGRDIVRQLADACHRNTFPLHLYYSHIDWTRDDYPMGRTGLRTGKDPKKANWQSYFTFMNHQLTELLTQYGPIRAVWFDGWWDQEKAKPAFNWQLPEQYALIHHLQPACLIGNNHHQTPNEGEDIQLFERDVPGENKAGMSGQSVSSLPLETCETMNGMWGYKVADTHYKSAEELIRLLVRTAGKGANLLLNIGPQADGNLPATAVSRLKEIGAWMKLHGSTIYDTEAGGLGDGEKVVSTRRGKELYVHVLDTTLHDLQLECAVPVKRITTFGSNTSVSFKQKKGKLQCALPLTTEVDRIMVLHLK